MRRGSQGEPASALEVKAAMAAAFLAEALLLARPLAGGGSGGGENGAQDGADAVLAAVRELGLVQMDPVRIVERNHDLVLRHRVAAPTATVRPTSSRRSNGGWCSSTAAATAPSCPWRTTPGSCRPWPRRQKRHGQALEGARPAVRTVLSALEKDGPLPSRVIESAEKVSGYWDAEAALRTKATSHALQLLWECGLVIAARRRNGEIALRSPRAGRPRRPAGGGAADGREGGRRFPAPQVLPRLPALRRGTRALRLPGSEGGRAPGSGPGGPGAGPDRRGADRGGAPAVLLPRRRPAAAGGRGGPAAGSARARILPPLDNLLWRRTRLLDLYRFAYTWEIYTPARRSGDTARTPCPSCTVPPSRPASSCGTSGPRGPWSCSPCTGSPGKKVWEGKPFRAALDGELERLRDFLGAATVEWAAAGEGGGRGRGRRVQRRAPLRDPLAGLQRADQQRGGGVVERVPPGGGRGAARGVAVQAAVQAGVVGAQVDARRAAAQGALPGVAPGGRGRGSAARASGTPAVDAGAGQPAVSGREGPARPPPRRSAGASRSAPPPPPGRQQGGLLRPPGSGPPVPTPGLPPARPRQVAAGLAVGLQEAHDAAAACARAGSRPGGRRPAGGRRRRSGR